MTLCPVYRTVLFASGSEGAEPTARAESIEALSGMQNFEAFAWRLVSVKFCGREAVCRLEGWGVLYWSLLLQLS